MKIHKIGNESFSIFDSSRKGEKMMVHFIWGKKDFRVYLQPVDGTPPSNESFPIVHSAAGDKVQVTGLQYLNNFEWCNYDAVASHGLAVEDVCWLQGKRKRYVELPKDFMEIAVKIACREFGFERRAG